MARKREKEVTIGNYFLKEKKLEFIPSGCAVLDCVLGGGYPIGRISNIIGDASTNKTGLSIEAIANFRKKYPNGYIWYQDAEAAFDIDYAVTIGLPKDERTFVIDDVKDITKTYNLIKEAINMAKEDEVNGLYVIDTLDALIPEDDELSEGYDAAKRAKLINSMLTNLAGKVDESNLHLMIVSQIRENIGVMFGSKYRVSGGKALGFYASQRLWLSEVKKLKRTIRGIEKIYGIEVKAKCKKNKVGVPFRECSFPVIFNYGIDDVYASLSWLKEIRGGLEELGINEKEIKDFAEKIIVEKDEETKEKIRNITARIWNEIEEDFMPKVSKY